MRTLHSTSLSASRLAPAVLGAAVGLAPLLGCVTTHSIAPDQLPAALESVPQRDQRRLVKGDDGKAVELPSPAHLRWVQVATRSAGDVQEFEPPVSAKVLAGGLHVEGKGVSRTYPLNAITSVRVRHDDHKADTIGGAVLLSFGVSAVAAASVLVAWDLGVIGNECYDECMRGLWSILVGAPVGGTGLLLTIPGAVLTTRGVGGLGQPPNERTARPAIPEISVAPGGAVVTVPF